MEVLEANQDPAGQNGVNAGARIVEAVMEREQPGVIPRNAPTFSSVNATVESGMDCPGPRCGHTLTAVGAVGEEGRLGYIGPRLILFGGATALEGNPFASGPPSSAASAGIRKLSALIPETLIC